MNFTFCRFRIEFLPSFQQHTNGRWNPIRFLSVSIGFRLRIPGTTWNAASRKRSASLVFFSCAEGSYRVLLYRVSLCGNTLRTCCRPGYRVFLPSFLCCRCRSGGTAHETGAPCVGPLWSVKSDPFFQIRRRFRSRRRFDVAQ